MAEPNFDGIDSLDGIDVDALSRGVSGAVTGLFPVTAELTATAAGETVDVVHERLVQTRQDLDATATDLARVAEAIRILREARDAWRRDAPRDAEIDAARQRWADARQALIDAADDGTAAVAAQRRCEAALRDLQALEEKRDAADNALKSALERAKGKLPERDSDFDGDSRKRLPAPNAPAPDAPAPSGPRPAPAPPRPPPAAVTPPPAAPAPSAGSGSDSQAALANLLAQIQRSSPVQAQPQHPAAQQQPQAPASQAAPLSSAPVSQPRKNNAIDSRDVDRLIDDKAGDAPTAVGLGLGSTGPTVTPSPAPTIPPSAPPPATNPGTSREGLSTSTPTNGRSGVEAGAFDSPQTKTSSAGPTATAAETGTGTRPGAGMGHGAPLIPPVGGIGSGGAGGMSPRESRDAPRVYNPEDQQDGSGPDVVRGGTIAQRRPDSAA